MTHTERTKNGCLCAASWSLADGVGKSAYRDGCARPGSPSGPRTCRVDQATCPAGVEAEFDECGAGAAEEEQEQQRATTWHSCACVPGWSYKYADGSAVTSDGCANPDADPLGPWCEVDPLQCDSFTTVAKGGSDQVRPPAPRSQ